MTLVTTTSTRIVEGWVTDHWPETEPPESEGGWWWSEYVIAINRYHGIVIVRRYTYPSAGDSVSGWQEASYGRAYLDSEIAGWLPLDVLPPLPPGDYRASGGSIWPTIGP